MINKIEANIELILYKHLHLSIKQFLEMIKFLKDWTLPIAMLVGIIGYPLFLAIEFTVPYLIFFMLLLTFSKVPLDKIKIKPYHLLMYIVQMAGAVGLYLALLPLNVILAQVAMVCFICPTATAAAVITAKLDGNMNSVTSYTLVSNMAATLVIPIMFAIVEPNASVSLLDGMLTIFKKVFPLLFGPFILAYIFSKYAKKVNQILVERTGFAFYLWAVSLSVAIAKTIQALQHYETSWSLLVGMVLVALLTCFLQFYIGKRIGKPFDDSKACGQALGQKNTILAIWIAYTYMNPLVTIGPGAYIFFQNGFNSYQLYTHNKRKFKNS